MSRWTFSNRWRIEGTLQALTPFHIGCGETLNEASLERRKGPRKGEDQAAGAFAEVSAVATDYNQQPYLPGTALKGALRSWLWAHLTDPDDRKRIVKVFGLETANRNDGSGGIAEFLDAFVDGSHPDSTHIPYKDDVRGTGIVASVAIDRRTRTAVDKLLYHEEYAPPDAKFQVVITGQDLDVEDVALMLFGLQQFAENAIGPIRLGAGGHNGWGKFALEGKPVVQRLLNTEINTWLSRARASIDAQKTTQGPEVYDGFDKIPFDPVPDDVQGQLDGQLDKEYSPLRTAFRADSRLVLRLELQFDGPFLVNEPFLTKPKDAPESDTRPNHAPRVDHLGHVVLPARSIRGAFRSQAEKILRTLNPNAGGDPNRPKNGCGPITRRAQVRKLGLLARLFGATGWATAVEFSDFHSASKVSDAEPRQEFVAIDRFTGGAAPGLKFNADYVLSPKLTGTITLKLKRIGHRGMGLLALTLRDLVESDIPFGFGAAKGYGRCAARLIKVDGGSVRGARSQPYGPPGFHFLDGLAFEDDQGNPIELDQVKERLAKSVARFRQVAPRFQLPPTPESEPVHGKVS